MTQIIEIPSTRARLEMRRALDNVRAGGHTIITRYNETEAVMVSPDWYQRAVVALFNAEVNSVDDE